jgi:uncharacterized membrane protein YfcA
LRPPVISLRIISWEVLNKKKELLTSETAARLVAIVSGITILFHVLVMLGVVPYEVVWGGRVTDNSQLMKLEAVSISINILIFGITVAGIRHRKTGKYHLLYKIFFWLLTILFLLNTLGNLASNNKTEKIIFTPVTFILALLCLKLALVKKDRYEYAPGTKK